MEYKLIKEYVDEILEKNREQKRLVSMYIGIALLKSCIIYGSKHHITLECYEIYKLFKKICKKEKNMYEYILKNRTIINYDEFCDLVDKLEILNDKTITYLYSMLDDIEDACDTKQEIRANHAKKKFNYLIEDDDYTNETLGLVLSNDEIKEFLNYKDEFWKYINPRVRIVDSHSNKKNIIYETVMHFDSNNKLDDIRVYVPKIVNLKTALINIHEFKHAYDLYNNLGKSIPEDINPYEISARELEEEFVKKYLCEKKF